MKYFKDPLANSKELFFLSSSNRLLQHTQRKPRFFSLPPMASFPQNHFQQFLQHPPSQSQQSNPYWDMYNNNNRHMEGQISQQVSYLNTPNLLDNHALFQVAGLTPAPANEENGSGSHWNHGFESKRKRPIEQVFLENNSNSNTNSQLSSVDFFQPRSVSTGLGLSLDNPRSTYSSGDSALLGLVGEALDQELQRQDAEIARCIKFQGDRLRQAIVEKLQMSQLQTVSYVEDKVIQKLREKESEIEDISRKNTDLEARLEQFALEANAWQQRARHSENTVNALKLRLQLGYAEGRDSKEGCGDSEIDDTASCWVGSGPSSSEAAVMTCEVCRVGEVCMLLLPCKHLCLCRDCEGRAGVCPVCGSSKYMGMEVFL